MVLDFSLILSILLTCDGVLDLIVSASFWLQSTYALYSTSMAPPISLLFIRRGIIVQCLSANVSLIHLCQSADTRFELGAVIALWHSTAMDNPFHTSTSNVSLRICKCSSSAAELGTISQFGASSRLAASSCACSQDMPSSLCLHVASSSIGVSFITSTPKLFKASETTFIRAPTIQTLLAVSHIRRISSSSLTSGMFSSCTGFSFFCCFEKCAGLFRFVPVIFIL